MAHKNVEETNTKHQPLTKTTQYRNAINELEQLQRHHELILQSVGEGIYGLDCNGHTTFVNEAARKMLGWELSELITKPQHDIIHHTKLDGSHYDAKDCPIYAAFKDGKVHRVDNEVFWRKDGTCFPVEYVSTPIRDDKGKLMGAVVAFNDITERKKAEKELQESRARFSGIVDIAQEAIISTDESEQIIMFNKGAEKTFNYSQNEVIGKSIDFLIPGKFHKVHRSHITKFVSSASPSHVIGERREIFGRRKNGEIFPAEASISKLQLDGHLILTVILRDITERKEAERAIQESNADLQNALTEVEQLKTRLEQENIYLQQEIRLSHNFEEIISQSKEFRKVLTQVEQVAATDSTVLILGESGTGKELIARAVHNISNRKERALVIVNCAALPSTLIESELFGHEKGAFTGAFARKIGRFELADGGSIFLDEIGEIPLELQPKLLRVLQDGEFERLGSTKTTKVSVRIIAATNRDLRMAVEKGEFREDLYYRLNVFPIHLLPLRERKEDIPLLAQHFLLKHGTRIGKQIGAITQKVMDALINYSWPGNVRELENIIERAVIITRGNKLDLGDSLPKNIGIPHKEEITTLDENERSYILKALEFTNWKISGERGAAKLLGIKRTTLESRMKKLNIQRS